MNDTANLYEYINKTLLPKLEEYFPPATVTLNKKPTPFYGVPTVLGISDVPDRAGFVKLLSEAGIEVIPITEKPFMSFANRTIAIDGQNLTLEALQRLADILDRELSTGRTQRKTPDTSFRSR